MPTYYIKGTLSGYLIAVEGNKIALCKRFSFIKPTHYAQLKEAIEVCKRVNEQTKNDVVLHDLYRVYDNNGKRQY